MFLGLHHIGRIRQDQVELPEIEFLLGVQHVGIDERRGLGTGRLQFGGEILAPGDGQRPLGVVHAHDAGAGNRQGNRPGDVSRAGAEVQDPDRIGRPAIGNAALLDPGRQLDGFTDQEFRFRTRDQDILVHLEDMAAEFGLPDDILNGFAGLEPDHCLGQGLHLLLVDLVLGFDDMRIALGSEHLGTQLEDDGLGLRRRIQALQRSDTVFQEFGQEHRARRFR